MPVLILTFLLAGLTLSVCIFMCDYVFDHGRTEKAFNAYVTIQAYLMYLDFEFSGFKMLIPWVD